MIDTNDKQLTNDYIVKPELNNEVKFKVLTDGSKIQRESKNTGNLYGVYEMKVLPDGEQEPKLLSVFSSEYKRMISAALGVNWAKLSSPTIVGCVYRMTHGTEVTKKYPDGHDVYPIEFVSKSV